MNETTETTGTTPADPAALQALLESTGLSIEQLTAQLQQLTPSGEQRDRSIAAAVAAATRALKPGAVQTYASYWRVLTDGIVLPATWSRARIDRYAADLAEVNRRQKLALELPEDIHACPRLQTGEVKRGGLIVYPGYGASSLEAIGEFEVRILSKWVGAHALAKSAEQDRRRQANGRGVSRNTGRGAEENFIGATRSLYTAAAENGLVAAGYSPAAKIRKPARSSESTRRTMFDDELRDVWRTCSTTGNDPELDALIFRVQMETASRQEGCINLVMSHLDDNRQSLWLDQKGDVTIEVPVSAALLRDLRAFAISRGSVDLHDPVLRQKGRHRYTGQRNPPLTSRRFDHIHERVREQHAWANHADWTSHWVRHHASALIEAIGGRPCKMRLLGHQPNGQTDGYGRASFEQLAWAVAVMTGEAHPLAQRPPWVGGG